MHEYLKTREPAVAGRFYPGEPHRLRHEVESLLKHARVSSTEGESTKALIAPHAGYVYSGPVAASGYALWVAERQTIRRIVLMGPAHFADFQGLALPSAAAFATPLGSVRIDPEGVAAISTLPQVKVNDDAHAREHSLEVHLPFLQVILGEFTLVPLAVGRATPEAIGEVVERLWGGWETRFVISSDLSHYLDSESARKLDALTADAIELLDPDRLQPAQACGGLPIRGFLRAARDHQLKAATLDLRNSGDTAGPRDRVVGYGAFAFFGK